VRGSSVLDDIAGAGLWLAALHHASGQQVEPGCCPSLVSCLRHTQEGIGLPLLCPAGQPECAVVLVVSSEAAVRQALAVV
jgi:hypothetical protein